MLIISMFCGLIHGCTAERKLITKTAQDVDAKNEDVKQGQNYRFAQSTLKGRSYTIAQIYDGGNPLVSASLSVDINDKTRNEYSNIILQGTVKEEEYAIFITDFSSYVFDFAYLGRSILYFFPDYEELSSGMSDYRDYHLPFQGTSSRFADNAEDAAKCIRSMVRHRGKLNWIQCRRMKKLFYHRDHQARERIYHSLIS